MILRYVLQIYCAAYSMKELYIIMYCIIVQTQLKVRMSTLASQTLERDKLVETKIALENRVTSSESKIHELQV